MATRCLILLLLLGPALHAADRDGTVVRPQAKAQTAPVPHRGDAADDPAIWTHPTHPERSLILGTDKLGGLHVYDLDGKDLQTAAPESHPNNVDVIYGFPLGGRNVDLAVAGTRGRSNVGVKVWLIDPEKRRLSDLTADKVLPTAGKETPYGICGYHSARTGRCYYFVTNKSGRIEQYELIDVQGQVGARPVRALKVKSVTEGCVADDELGFLYVAEEKVGIWKFAAEPDAPTEGRLIARVKEHGLTADVEGLTIYGARNGKGYLIASSQGSNTFKVYARDGDNAFVATIDPARGAIDDVNDTDGIAVTNRATSRQFPRGFLIVQDGHNSGGNQNFKLYDWRDIAGDQLLIDPEWNPRMPSPETP